MIWKGYWASIGADPREYRPSLCPPLCHQRFLFLFSPACWFPLLLRPRHGCAGASAVKAVYVEDNAYQILRSRLPLQTFWRGMARAKGKRDAIISQLKEFVQVLDLHCIVLLHASGTSQPVISRAGCSQGSAKQSTRDCVGPRRTAATSPADLTCSAHSAPMPTQQLRCKQRAPFVSAHAAPSNAISHRPG